MICLHPNCPMGNGLPTWKDVVSDPRIVSDPNLKVRLKKQTDLETELNKLGPLGKLTSINLHNKALRERLLDLVPCLYTQLNFAVSADAIVHLCEVTLGKRIDSSNAYDAFQIQNPKDFSHTFTFPPILPGSSAGEISESLCNEILSNEGLPELELDKQGWPIYNKIGYIRLNKGQMRAVKAFGDFLIPCAPSNLIISVKTQAAKERLLYSANMIEGIGIGFFNKPSEFWSPSRMNLFKRMGFTAIYLPDSTHMAIKSHLKRRKLDSLATNVNGKELYRPISKFGIEMKSIAGKHSMHL